MDPENIVDEPETGDEERRAIRLLLGGRTLRRRKLRRLALAHLLNEGGEGAEDDEMEEDEGGEEQRAIRMLLGGRTLRRRKLRRLALAHLLRERAA